MASTVELITRYLQASKDANAAKETLLPIVGKIVQIADMVRDNRWKTVFVRTLDQVGPGPSIVAEEWPSASQFSEAIDAWRLADREKLALWGSIPESEKSTLRGPD